MARTRQLLCNSQTCWTGPNHGHALASFHTRRLRNDPTFFPRAINDFHFDLLNRHRAGINSHDASRFAWCWAQATSELRKVVGGMQTVNGILPMTAIHQIVPIGNQVPQWASVIAERDTTIHATSRLLIQLVMIEWLVDLFPVP